MRTVAVLALALVLVAPVAGSDRVAVHVLYGVIRTAPATVRLRIVVEPHEANRVLVVEAESGTYYRRSDFQLDGASSARTREVDYRDWEGGEYEIRAIVYTNEGTTYRSRASVTVVDMRAD